MVENRQTGHDITVGGSVANTLALEDDKPLLL
jgi:hypothetical protein